MENKKFLLTKFIFFFLGILIILGLSFVFLKSSFSVLAQARNQESIFKIAVGGYQCRVCSGDSKCQFEQFDEFCVNECSTNADCGVSPTVTPTPTDTPTPTGQYVFTRARYPDQCNKASVPECQYGLSTTSLVSDGCVAAVCMHVKECWWNNMEPEHNNYTVDPGNANDWAIVQTICNTLGLAVPGGSFVCNKDAVASHYDPSKIPEDEQCGYNNYDCADIPLDSCPTGIEPGGVIAAVCKTAEHLDLCPGGGPPSTHLECEAQEETLTDLRYGYNCSSCVETIKGEKYRCQKCAGCTKCYNADCSWPFKEATDCRICTDCSYDQVEGWACSNCATGKITAATCVRVDGEGYDPACEGKSKGATCTVSEDTGDQRIIGCSVAVKIADQQGYTKAWTNRVNRIQNFDTQILEINKNKAGVNGKKYQTQCRPWGAILNFQTNSLTKYRLPDQFGCDLINAGPAYTGLKASTDVAGRLFVKTYETRYWDEIKTVPVYSIMPPGTEGHEIWSWDGTSHVLNPLPKIEQIKINQQGSGTLTGQKYFMANLSFYASADKDQMPIREVSINWGDGKTSGQDISLYAKNRKPICSIGADGFGGSSTACQTKPFEAAHLYRCPTGQTCSFVPQICIKDNWGKQTCAPFGGRIEIGP